MSVIIIMEAVNKSVLTLLGALCVLVILDILYHLKHFALVRLEFDI